MDENSQNKYFYCYSKRMSLFIRSFNIRYSDSDVNKNTNTKYYLFEKCERLDKIIELYNKVKYLV